jgi:hypothetical protein
MKTIPSSVPLLIAGFVLDVRDSVMLRLRCDVGRRNSEWPPAQTRRSYRWTS